MSYYLVSEDNDTKTPYGYFPKENEANNAKAYLKGYKSGSDFLVTEHDERTEKVPLYQNAGDFISAFVSEGSM